MTRYLTSELLTEAGFLHGFSVRAGGVSRPPFDALNLSAAVGDDPAAVAENLRRLAEEAGAEGFLQVSQVHGRRVVDVDSGTDPESLKREEADALATSAPGRVVAVRPADCVPILLGDPVSGAVAAVHAGWRGTAERIAQGAVEALNARHGARADRVVAAIGPSIRACCYEVDEALAARFEGDLGPGTVRPVEGGRPHLDLVEANLRILEAAGVGRGRVEVLDACTACDPDRFFSHRRDGAQSGRHLSFIGRPPADSLT